MKRMSLILIIGLMIAIVLFVLPQVDPGAGSSVQLSEATLYDENGVVLGKVEPGGLMPGSYVTAPDGGQASYAVVEISYEIWLYDSDQDPANAEITVDFYKRDTLAGAYVQPEEEIKIQNAIRQEIVGQWTYEGTSRRSDGKDWVTSGTTAIKVTVDDLEDTFKIRPGQTGVFQGIVRAQAGPLETVKRSGNTISFKLAEDYDAELVIEKVTVG